jgi:hypothetical protein
VDSQTVFHPYHIVGIIKRPKTKKSKTAKKSAEESEIYNYWSSFIDTMYRLKLEQSQHQDGGRSPDDILYFKGTKKKIYVIDGKQRVRYGKLANGKIRYVAISTYKKLLSTQHLLQ